MLGLESWKWDSRYFYLSIAQYIRSERSKVKGERSKVKGQIMIVDMMCEFTQMKRFVSQSD
jgi:hypothetical protein